MKFIMFKNLTHTIVNHIVTVTDKIGFLHHLYTYQHNRCFSVRTLGKKVGGLESPPPHPFFSSLHIFIGKNNNEIVAWMPKINTMSLTHFSQVNVLQLMGGEVNEILAPYIFFCILSLWDNKSQALDNSARNTSKHSLQTNTVFLLGDNRCS